MSLIFSGIQPTGNLHLGNYLGAIRNWVDLQNSYDCIFCVVDMHAITLWQDPKELHHSIREVTAGLIAAGVDPEKHILFNQSQVWTHASLSWVFNCVARIGWLNRMTQFKEKAGKHKEKASVGLYAYPTLMAADILAYCATHVPVGEDQKQHLELTREIAGKFNYDYGREFFPLVEPLILGESTRVMSLRDGTKKMSKSDTSDYSRINMTDDADTIALKIRKARTDQHPLPESLEGLGERAEAGNLVSIYASLAGRTRTDVLAEFGGSQFSDFKQKLADLAVSVLAPINAEMNRLMEDPAEIDRTLNQGAERARAKSEPIMREVYDILGFVS